jgi:hypothetical protein
MSIHFTVASQTFVYRNLHQKCFSLRKAGKVYGYANTLFAKDVTFKVSEAGRKRVLETRRKNVHAGILSPEIITDFATVEAEFAREYSQLSKISYNPYTANGFFLVDSGAIISGAEKVYLTRSGGFALKPY